MVKLTCFDLDGTLVDMTEAHRIALNRALKEISNYEIPLDEHYKIYNGLPTNFKLMMLADLGKINRDDFGSIWLLKQKYTEEAIENTLSIDWQKIKLHQCLWNRGIKICCVTNSIRKTAELALKKTGQYEYIDFIITNEDVKPKPDPSGYVLAAYKMILLRSEVLCVEDSPKGIEAAVKSGCNVMQVKDPSEVTFKTVLDKIFEINNGLVKDIKCSPCLV